MSPETAVLFDLDDTLYDHRHAVRAGLRVLRAGVPVYGTLKADELERLFHRFLEEAHPLVLRGEWSPARSRRERFRMLADHVGLALSEASWIARSGGTGWPT